MTLAFDSLAATNKALNAEIAHLRAEVELLKHRLVTDSIEKE